MSSIQKIVNQVADELQAMMESQQHLSNPARANELVDKLSFYWAFLDDELKDYTHCCQMAIDDKLEWNV